MKYSPVKLVNLVGVSLITTALVYLGGIAQECTLVLGCLIYGISLRWL